MVGMPPAPPMAGRPLRERPAVTASGSVVERLATQGIRALVGARTRRVYWCAPVGLDAPPDALVVRAPGRPGGWLGRPVFYAAATESVGTGKSSGRSGRNSWA